MLHCENALLEDRGNQLRREIENMETLTRQQAAIQMRVHLHDALGQQMAVLLKMLRGQAIITDMKVMRLHLKNLILLTLRKKHSQRSVHLTWIK